MVLATLMEDNVKQLSQHDQEILPPSFLLAGPEKARDLTDDMGLSNGHSCDLHPLPETDEGITTPCSSSPHGSHENETVVVPRYNGWPFNTAKGCHHLMDRLSP